jgi:blue copper oxidase
MVTKKRTISVYAILYTALSLLLAGLLLFQVINAFTPSVSTQLKAALPDDEKGVPLAMPAVLDDSDPDPMKAYFELDAQPGQMEFIPGMVTSTLGYNGNYLGPVLRVKRGQEVQIKVNNLMDKPTTAHWHGMDVDGPNDGGPHQGIMPGESWTARFTIDQPAATVWYHPHFHHTTGAQVYHGLAGLIYIEDEESEDLSIPREYGVNDIPLVIQDRNFNSDGSFHHNMTMMGLEPGEFLLVNGTLNPYLELERELVRFRILNGSNYENLHLTFSDGSSFHQIASDGGFLDAPVNRDFLFLSPGERAEILVDFSAVTSDHLAIMNGSDLVLDLYLSGAVTQPAEVPASLVTVPEIHVGENPTTRIFTLESTGIHGTINGKEFDMNRIDEVVPRQETELWVIRNTDRARHTPGHPFHVHGTQFQIVSRDGAPPPPEERGLKDTIFVANGEEVVIKIQFHHDGLFMYHCHMLEHEEHGMMGQFLVE